MFKNKNVVSVQGGCFLRLNLNSSDILELEENFEIQKMFLGNFWPYLVASASDPEKASSINVISVVIVHIFESRGLL